MLISRVVCAAFAMALLATAGCNGRDTAASRTAAPANEAADQTTETQQAAEAESSAAGEASDSGAAAAADGEGLWVAQARGNLQCEGGGLTLAQSRGTLESGGIEVAESRCAVRTDRMYTAVCGGGTGDMLFHRIPQAMLDAALELGFDPASQIPHRFVDCPADSAADPKSGQ